MVEGEKKVIWTGWVLSVLVSLPFVLSAVMKLIVHPEVVKGMAHLGLPESLIRPLGVVELLCVVIYLVPRTAFFGAILFTGYMGGTIITHLRVGEPIYVNALLGILIWLGLYLRSSRLRDALRPA